jgi:hypothetical protein
MYISVYLYNSDESLKLLGVTFFTSLPDNDDVYVYKFVYLHIYISVYLYNSDGFLILIGVTFFTSLLDNVYLLCIYP